jgi:hypothetical protein
MLQNTETYGKSKLNLNMKLFFIPIIIGATGIVTKGLKKIWKHCQGSVH